MCIVQEKKAKIQKHHDNWHEERVGTLDKGYKDNLARSEVETLHSSQRQYLTLDVIPLVTWDDAGCNVYKPTSSWEMPLLSSR